MAIKMPTVAEMRKMRDDTGLGFDEVRKVFLRRQLHLLTNAATDVEDLKEVISTLIDNL